MDLPRTLPVDLRDLKTEEDVWINKFGIEALNYISNFKWVESVKIAKIELAFYKMLVLCSFEINPARKGIDRNIWVVTGNLPSAYFVGDRINDNSDALIVYCDIMEDWVNCIFSGGNLHNCFPVNADPTWDNAKMLSARIKYIREELI